MKIPVVIESEVKCLSVFEKYNKVKQKRYNVT